MFKTKTFSVGDVVHLFGSDYRNVHLVAEQRDSNGSVTIPALVIREESERWKVIAIELFNGHQRLTVRRLRRRDRRIVSGYVASMCTLAKTHQEKIQHRNDMIKKHLENVSAVQSSS